MKNLLRRASVALPLVVATFASAAVEAKATQGVPILNFDQSSRDLTEVGSEYRIDASNRFEPQWRLLTDDGDAFARLSFKRLRSGQGRPQLQVALWGPIGQRRSLPRLLAQNAQGLSVELSATCHSAVRARLKDAEGREIVATDWRIGPVPFSYRINADISLATTVIFEFDTDHDVSRCRTISIDIDDLIIENGTDAPFSPPEEDTAFLDWLFRSSFNFFDWNFFQTGPDEGVVLERQDQLDQVSSSGQGYAIAIYIIGTEKGYLDRTEAHRRVSSIVNWLQRQEWEGGANGWHGFPYHWYRTDKSPHWPAVSTIDWAMLAAGLRVARQYFADDPMLVAKITELLSRPAWNSTIRPDGRIGMGFLARDGALDPYSWGLAFSEESELVYLEAIAADLSNTGLLQHVERQSRYGFCPSWFGSGFTYNWMQLWTGSLAPLSANSRAAFAFDLHTNLQAFQRPLIGLTAMQTMTAVDEDGFFVQPRYFSHQGSLAHQTLNDDEVVQIAPAPYGAALALPFLRAESVRALREFVELGFYHEYLGLPDSVLLTGLPDGIHGVPSYRHLDLNIGALGMAIDQASDGTIARLYRSDPDIASALDAWQRQTTPHFQACAN